MLMYAYFNIHVCSIEIHNIGKKKYVFLYVFFFRNTYFIYWVFLFQYTCVYLNVDVCVFQYTCMQHWNTQHWKKKYVFLYVFFLKYVFYIFSIPISLFVCVFECWCIRISIYMYAALKYTTFQKKIRISIRIFFEIRIWYIKYSYFNIHVCVFERWCIPILICMCVYLNVDVCVFEYMCVYVNTCVCMWIHHDDARGAPIYRKIQTWTCVCTH